MRSGRRLTSTRSGGWSDVVERPLANRSVLADQRQVRAANRAFFDTVADVYEEVDGRRSEDVVWWLNGVLCDLAEQAGGGSLLDLGCGTGLVMRIGAGHFCRVYGIDISRNILDDARRSAAGVVSGDVSRLPFADNTFNALSCFAVLHHLYSHRDTIEEAYRVLKPGGVLYTDHDMDAAFMRRFRWPMAVYRRLCDAGRRYLRAKHELTRELYDLSEVHSDGIPTGAVVQTVREAGFRQVSAGYHWLGLNSVVNWGSRLVGCPRNLPRGWAPLATIWAVK